MAQQTNLVVLEGNVVRDVTTAGTTEKPQAYFDLANNQDYRNKNGDVVKRANFVSIAGFGGAAKLIKEYVKKGMHVQVTGELRVSTNEKDGKTYTNTTIVVGKVRFLDPRQNESASTQNAPADDMNAPVDDDDIPF